MCGIYGIAGPDIANRDFDILEQMAYVSALRGTDASGMVQGRGGYAGVKDLIVEKDKVDISYFLFKHKWMQGGNRKLFNGFSNNFFAGHVRAATKGILTKENAHPFETKEYVGMHNGTLKDKKYQHTTKTDSELLIQDISQNGIDVLLDLDKDSAYALVLVDKENGELVFTRNKDRTLYYGLNDTRSVIYWASEAWMVQEICNRNLVKLSNDNTVYYFEPGKVYRHAPYQKSRSISAVFEVEELASFREPKKTKAVKAVEKTEKKASDTGKKSERKTPRELLKEWKEKNPDSPVRIRLKADNDLPVAGTETHVQPPRIPASYCCGCHKPLSLFEQYTGTKFGVNTLVCDDCNNQSVELLGLDGIAEVSIN